MMEVDGQTPETIAKTFGTTVAAVKGRLRYGLIHPDIRAAARGKVITLDTMKAFAEHPSQEAQREVFEGRCQLNSLAPRKWPVLERQMLAAPFQASKASIR